MENDKELISNVAPMEMDRNQKLKVFAVSSIRNDVPRESVEDKTILSIVFAYSAIEALATVAIKIKEFGRNPEEYEINFQMMSTELESILPNLAIMQDARDVITEKPKEEPIEVSLESHMIGNVRQVFSLVGTKNEKETSEKVIKRFETYAKKQKTS